MRKQINEIGTSSIYYGDTYYIKPYKEKAKAVI